MSWILKLSTMDQNSQTKSTISEEQSFKALQLQNPQIIISFHFVKERILVPRSVGPYIVSVKVNCQTFPKRGLLAGDLHLRYPFKMTASRSSFDITVFGVRYAPVLKNYVQVYMTVIP